MTDRRQQTQLLVQAGRLLLEYNESSGAIIDALALTARTLTDSPIHVVITYRSIAVSLGEEAPVLRTVKELRLNAAVQTRIHDVLRQLRAGKIEADVALVRLSEVESSAPRHPRWLVALFLGAAACSFARLLGADAAAVGIAGIATAIGLLARQELGRRHVSLLALPFTAAFIGAVLGGIAIRFGWTRSPEQILIVPALMVVPGPHLLNGLFDLVDNYLPMSLSRLGLALGILAASAAGIALGVRLTLPSANFPERPAVGVELNLLADMVLAGIATCGFAAFFNTPWRSLWLAVVGGMVGHGIRFLGVESGFQLESATLMGGLVVGAISGWVVRSSRAPVAVIAFAGAVTMIPGSSIYRALGGTMRLAQLTDGSDAVLAASTLSHASEGFVVVCGLAVGVVLGIRGVVCCVRPAAQG